MAEQEYLVAYGTSGDFSRFRAAGPVHYGRGDRVVVQTAEGLELGVVLCPFTAGHEHFLNRTAVGQLLRAVGADEDQAADRLRRQAQRVFEHARALAAELGLPLEVIDVELPLDGERAVVHYLARAACDYRPLVSALSSRHNLLVVMQNEAPPAAETVGCGKPDCGQAGGGGCDSCGPGGSCSAGGCGSAVRPEEVITLLAGRTPLL